MEDEPKELKESLYEITFLAKTEDISSLRQLFSKYGVEVIDERQLIKVSLQYPIKKMLQAFLGVFVFKIETQKLKSLSLDLNLSDDVLRYLVTEPIKKSNRGIKSMRGKSPLINDVGVSQTAIPTQIRRRQEDAQEELTNEALEKKIEEILQ